MHHDWRTWIGGIWQLLNAGHRVVAPESLIHPRQAGFALPRMAEPVGQVADWVFPWPDGSRIHVHEMADGSLKVHRDRFDPGQGAVRAVCHLVVETRYFRAGLVLVGGLILAG